MIVIFIVNWILIPNKNNFQWYTLNMTLMYRCDAIEPFLS